MARNFINQDWQLPAGQNGEIANWDAVHAALLMDIREELRLANKHLSVISDNTTVLTCGRFLKIPAAVNRIVRNTERPKRGKKK